MQREVIMKEEKEYVASLECFLTASNEDKVDVDAIIKQISDYINFDNLQKKKNFKILDVGSGNGAKAIYFAKRLSERGLTVLIDSIEPKKEQRDHLKINYEKEGNLYLGKIYDTTLAQADLREGSAYDCIILIHSIYEFPRDDDGTVYSLEKIPDLLNENGIGIIIVEHVNGDFQKLKHEFYPRFNKKEPVSENIIRQTLEVHNIKYRQGELVEFEFLIGDVNSLSDFKIGQRMAFLFSDSLYLLDSKQLSESELSAIGKWVRQHINHNGKEGPSLWTPDTIFWVYGNSSV